MFPLNPKPVFVEATSFFGVREISKKVAQAFKIFDKLRCFKNGGWQNESNNYLLGFSPFVCLLLAVYCILPRRRAKLNELSGGA
jgi:hypothetical protein